LRLDKSSPLAGLKDFNEPYLRARNECWKWSNTKDKEKRDERLKNAIAAFSARLGERGHG